VSRLVVIAVSIAVGLVLAVGATFTASAVLGSTGAPPNRPPFNYGSP
jgi:hypothetical protein